MVCSTCGYENQTGHRFCGMCGTPLPHRPLTAPGAASTHSFTRVPLESATTGQRELVAAGTPPARGGPAAEASSAEPGTEPGTGPPRTNKKPALPSAVEMVPEVPLEEYVKSFHYIPPADPIETTMRGDAQAVKPARAAPDAAANVSPKAPPIVSGSPAGTTDDVRNRLGLEETATGEDRGDRPRFLDFSEPAGSVKQPPAPVVEIAGPSFLGLNAAPSATTDAAERPEHSQRRSGGWLSSAIAVVVVLAALGGLEWRSRVYHTNDGPLEIIKARLGSFRRNDTQPPKSEASADVGAAQPQAQEESKPQIPDQSASANTNPAGATTASNTPATNPSTNTIVTKPEQNAQEATGKQAAAEQKPATPAPGLSSSEAQPSSVQRPDRAKPSSAVPVATAGTTGDTSNSLSGTAERVKPKPPAKAADEEEVAARKMVPGDEELQKANNASDSVAAAAWLWKATAKGNPDAPVRLADLYLKGDGVPRSCEQALVLLQAAATKGNAQARTRLAQVSNSGKCVPGNR